MWAQYDKTDNNKENVKLGDASPLDSNYLVIPINTGHHWIFALVICPSDLINLERDQGTARTRIIFFDSMLEEHPKRVEEVRAFLQWLATPPRRLPSPDLLEFDTIGVAYAPVRSPLDWLPNLRP